MRELLTHLFFCLPATTEEVRSTGIRKYMTLDDRKKLSKLYLRGDRPQDIADQLGVHVATVYNELKRGDTGKLDKNMRQGYSAPLAQKRLYESLKRRGHRTAAAAK